MRIITEEVIKAVMAQKMICRRDLMHSLFKEHIHARWLVIVVLLRNTDLSMCQIAADLGKDHTTIRNCKLRSVVLIEEDRKFLRDLNKLELQLKDKFRPSVVARRAA